MTKNKNDDFFSLIEKEQKIENPFAADEILFRDKSGNLKILKGGEVLDFDQKLPSSTAGTKVSKPVSTKPAISPPSPVIAVKEKVLPPPVDLSPAALAKAGKPLDVDREVETIIKESGVELPGPNLVKRFKSIITSRLKGVRDQVQTREILLASPLMGGMGFEAAIADKVLAIISQEFEQLDGKLRQAVSQEPFFDLKAEAKELLAQPPTIVFKAKPAIEEIEEELARLDSTSQAESVVPPPEISPLEQKPQARPKAEPVSIARPIARADGAKPKIEDVKFKPKLTGPVAEIRTMTLTDFRRLAQTPDEVIKKILEKIELLEEESFTKKVEAIKAWQENEVYQLYLELGDESMEEKRPIADIVAERQQANQPTLTEEEIEAVMELNKRLRY